MNFGTYTPLILVVGDLLSLWGPTALFGLRLGFRVKPSDLMDKLDVKGLEMHYGNGVSPQGR